MRSPSWIGRSTRRVVFFKANDSGHVWTVVISFRPLYLVLDIYFAFTITLSSRWVSSCGAETAYFSEPHEFTLSFRCGQCYSFLVFCAFHFEYWLSLPFFNDLQFFFITSWHPQPFISVFDLHLKTNILVIRGAQFYC